MDHISKALLVSAFLVVGGNQLLGQNLGVASSQSDDDKSLVRRATNTQLVIEPGDMISVTVFDAPELSLTSVRVADDGTVSIPLIGAIKISFLTEHQAAARLDEEFARCRFLLKPQSTVVIREFAYTGVTVAGEVTKPGIYPIPGPRSVVDVIAMAGGLTSAADSQIALRRSNSNIEEVIDLPLQNGLKALSDDIEVHPGDRIIARRAHTIYVLGDVTRPGGYLMQPDGRITVLQAIARAEGTTRTAAINSTILLRKSGDSVISKKIALSGLYKGKVADIALEANDVLYVPNSTLRSLSTNAPEIFGAVAVASIYAATQ